MLSKTAVHHFGGSNVALGTAAGKLFRVGFVILLFVPPFLHLPPLFLYANADHADSLIFSIMTISDQGDSDLLTIAEGTA